MAADMQELLEDSVLLQGRVNGQPRDAEIHSRQLRYSISCATSCVSPVLTWVV